MQKVLYDANVLYAAPMRDLLMHLALTTLFSAHWTAEIQAEWLRNVAKNRPDIAPSKLEHTQHLMNQAVPTALITNYEAIIPSLELPDPDDRHVLAAAIVGQVNIIVTLNLRDFPKTILEPFSIRALHPDDFVFELLSVAPVPVLSALKLLRQSMKNPVMTALEYIALLQRQGLFKTAQFLLPFAAIL